MLKLEYFERKDFNQLINWINTEELLVNWAGSLFSFPLTTESLEWYISDTNVPGISEAFVYRVVEESTGETVGHISLGGLSWKNRSARISRVLTGAVSAQKKGYCQAMIQALLKIGFEELNLHRIALGVYDDNIPAIKCYRNSGFITEGISREILWMQDGWRSMIEMSMLESEWKERAVHFVSRGDSS